jgi:predicted transcriptional regulator
LQGRAEAFVERLSPEIQRDTIERLADALSPDFPLGDAVETFIRREGWREARERAVKRGVPNGRAPYGYRKRPDGRLEIDRAAELASHLREI